MKIKTTEASQAYRFLEQVILRTGKTFKVLITGAGTATALCAFKGLKAMADPSIRVLMGDMQPNCAGAYLGDEFVCMPSADDPEFRKRVTEICRCRDVGLVIPTIDYEFPAWSEIADQLLANGTRVAISSPSAIEQCRQKDLTIAYFRRMELPCPETWRVSQIADPSGLPYPVFLKPRCGRASLNTHRVENLEEYLYYASKTQDCLVQPCLMGREVTIDTLSTFDGRFLAACPRERVEVKSGQAYRSVTLDAPELTAYARRIVEGLPLIGPANIQCFLTDRGPQFFEINTRFGAGTALSIHAGLNGPAALVAMARGEALPTLQPRPNVWMLRYWQEAFVERAACPIFFDLDGPILDVSYRHYQVYCDIAKETGLSPASFEIYWNDKRARKPHLPNAIHGSGEGSVDADFNRKWLERIETEPYLGLDRVWPWVIDVLSNLYRDHPLYLVTVRSRPDLLTKQLERLNLARWFQAVLCCPARENASRAKIEGIRRHFSHVPREAVIVGDTEADIDCGKELGFHTVGVLSGIRNRDHLESSCCDSLLEDIRALPQHLATLCGGPS